MRSAETRSRTAFSAVMSPRSVVRAPRKARPDAIPRPDHPRTDHGSAQPRRPYADDRPNLFLIRGIAPRLVGVATHDNGETARDALLPSLIITIADSLELLWLSCPA